MDRSRVKDWFRVQIWPLYGGGTPEWATVSDIRAWLYETGEEQELIYRLGTVEDAVLTKTTGLVDKVAVLEAATYTPISEAPKIPVKASVSTGADEDWEIKWEAVTAGNDGNKLTIAISNGTGENSPIKVTVRNTSVGSDITVNLATDADGDPDNTTNTATAVLGAVNRDEVAGRLIQGTRIGGGGVCAEEAKTFLLGGKDGTPGAAGEMRIGNGKVFLSVGESTGTTYNWKSITFDTDDTE